MADRWPSDTLIDKSHWGFRFTEPMGGDVRDRFGSPVGGAGKFVIDWKHEERFVASPILLAIRDRVVRGIMDGEKVERFTADSTSLKRFLDPFFEETAPN
jgi:hypothetical protein